MKFAQNQISLANKPGEIMVELSSMCTRANIFKNCGGFTKKPVGSSGCDAAIKLSENKVSSNQITEEVARDPPKDLF